MYGIERILEISENNNNNAYQNFDRNIINEYSNIIKGNLEYKKSEDYPLLDKFLRLDIYINNKELIFLLDSLINSIDEDANDYNDKIILAISIIHWIEHKRGNNDGTIFSLISSIIDKIVLNGNCLANDKQKFIFSTISYDDFNKLMFNLHKSNKYLNNEIDNNDNDIDNNDNYIDNDIYNNNNDIFEILSPLSTEILIDYGI